MLHMLTCSSTWLCLSGSHNNKWRHLDASATMAREDMLHDWLFHPCLMLSMSSSHAVLIIDQQRARASAHARRSPFLVFCHQCSENQQPLLKGDTLWGCPQQPCLCSGPAWVTPGCISAKAKSSGQHELPRTCSSCCQLCYTLQAYHIILPDHAACRMFSPILKKLIQNAG